MRKALSLSIIITILAVIAYITKPSREACINKALQEFKEKKLSYTTQTLPEGVNQDVFRTTAERSFLQSLDVADRFLYREIVQKDDASAARIGWAAFGFISVNIR